MSDDVPRSRVPRGSLGGALSVLAAVVILAGWWVFLAPISLGGPASYVVIRGDSMLPTLEGGDLVVVRAADRYAVGDVVAYRVPAGELGEGSVVIHRIVDGDAGGWVVVGDNNPAPDPWRPRSTDVVGTVWLRVPLLGRAIALLLRPVVAGAIAVALVAGFLALRWGPRGRSPLPAPVRSIRATRRRLEPRSARLET